MKYEEQIKQLQEIADALNNEVIPERDNEKYIKAVSTLAVATVGIDKVVGLLRELSELTAED